MKPKVYDAKLTDFLPDSHNANAGTERGRYMVGQSIQAVGAGRSLVADKNGVIVAGNKTQEALVDSGIDDAIVVETDGKQIVIVKRTDFDLADENPNNPARQYAYYDNRAGEVGLSWDVEVMQVDAAAGFDFEPMFRADELEWGVEPPDFKEYDESIADEVEMVECPECGHRFPK